MEAAQDARRPTLLQQVQADRELERQFEARVRPYLDRIEENIQRVSRLLHFFDEDLKEHEGREDILRAAVVFLHANLEDFLRTLAGELLPVGDEASLKDIPLLGGNFGRGEKFVLGQLTQYKGKTVDELLRESVSDYLGRSTFNSTTEIAALLSRLGFNVEEHNQRFSDLDEMIQRRHQIVHRADKVKDTEKQVLQPIDSPQVVEWLGATHTFIAGLLTPFMLRLPGLVNPRKRKRR